MNENHNEGNPSHRDSERYQGSDRSRGERGLGTERSRNRDSDHSSRTDRVRDRGDSSERVTSRESGGDRGTGRGSREGSESVEGLE